MFLASRLLLACLCVPASSRHLSARRSKFISDGSLIPVSWCTVACSPLGIVRPSLVLLSATSVIVKCRCQSLSLNEGAEESDGIPGKPYRLFSRYKDETVEARSTRALSGETFKTSCERREMMSVAVAAERKGSGKTDCPELSFATPCQVDSGRNRTMGGSWKSIVQRDASRR